MLKKLAARGLVRVEPYRGAELTTEGLHHALRVVRRHRLLELFLHRVMGFPLQDLHARALTLQSAIDEEFEDRMDAMLDHPKIDPHGQPIPSKNATWPKLGDSSLLDLHPVPLARSHESPPKTRRPFAICTASGSDPALSSSWRASPPSTDRCRFG